ncbi:hypothetical protein PVAND_015804 [Polypedilum vanderplanki]|uniref:UDP-glucuronosyltransferase n=1 Tax=Polypedilum vanderplanki TaxID=319348 RepID=A0A9J6BE97_POLVA|nr:hypothetical protein PVAND_015804 [Polypedilum vanderplanki]
MKLLLTFTIFLKFVNSANILAIFPIASVSHNAVYRALTDELENRGHTLTIITTNPRKENKSPNSVEIDFSFMYKVIGKLVDFNKWKSKELDEVAMLGLWTEVFDAYFDEQFNHPTIKEMIKQKDKFFYDVIIVEFMNQIPWQAFALLFNAPVVGISSLDMMHTYHYEHGNVMNPILHPDFIFPFYDNLSFMQRARVLRYYLWYHLYYKGLYNRQFDNIIKRHMGTLSLPTDALNSIAEVLLVNAHPALGHVRPILPTTVQLGFMHIKEPKEITDEKIKKFLNASKKPIIYMSLGSMVKSSQLSENSIEIFKNTFEFLKNEFDVMWKWEDDEMKNQPENVFISKWFPQADLLAHERVKIFISQGGQQSMEEAIDRGVPLIVIPFAADQHSNAQRITNLKIGIFLDISTLSKESLLAPINQISSGNFTENVQKLSEIVKDEPMKPVEKAVWWVEYVARHGGTLHLDYRGRHVPFWKYLMLDFIAIAIVAWHLTIKLLKFILKKIFTPKKKTKKNKKE